MITTDSLRDKTKIYYAVYIPLHDGIPHYLVPLEVNFDGIHIDSYTGEKYLRVSSYTRSAEYRCQLEEDNPILKRTFKPTHLLKLVAYQHSWLPKGNLYITDDKSLLVKPIRNFYKEELHKGIRTARGNYQAAMYLLKQLNNEIILI